LLTKSVLSFSAILSTAKKQHQGRIIALMWVQKQNDDFYLDFALNLKTVVQNRLQMFALNAEVVLKPLTPKKSMNVYQLNHKPYIRSFRIMQVLNSCRMILIRLLMSNGS
jgi:folate-binding Fe-S cluster repair protein YgfZ